MSPTGPVDNDMPRAYREFVIIQAHQAMSGNDNIDFLVIRAVSVASNISARGDGNEVNEVAVDSIRSLKGSMGVYCGGAAMSHFRFKRDRLEKEVSWYECGQWLLQVQKIILGAFNQTILGGWHD
jgi:hypothetical protein